MKKITALLVSIILIMTLAACSVIPAATTSTTETSSQNAPEMAATSESATTASQPAAATDPASAIIYQDIHEDASDYVWDAAAVVPMTLDRNTITTSGAGVSINGSIATITAAGVYSLSGTLTDGQILVNAPDDAVVQLILNGVNLNNSTGSPLVIEEADKAILILVENTQNVISDSSAYVFASADTDEPNAAIFSKSDLTIYGSGALTVTGNYNDGIASKDGLLIASGTVSVTALDDGIRGKDYVAIKDGTITISSQGDGLKSDNEEETDRGFITIAGGTITITSGADAVQAAKEVFVTSGALTLVTGGGSQSWTADTSSAKGIIATVGVTVDGGILSIDSADDALHSNGSITVNGGSLTLASGDDGLHADADLTINGGDIRVTRSYEGLEGAVITVNAGNVLVTASDDGFNVAGGADGSGMGPGMLPPGGRPGGQDSFASVGSYYLYINGGYIFVDAGGDGLDSNGAIVMTGGTAIVNGPTENMNGALDYMAFTISGGTIIAVGSAGMAQAAGSDSSSQYAVLVNYDSVQPAGTLIHIQNSAGEDILTFAPTRQYQSITFSSPALTNGETYTLYSGGSSTGTALNGQYQGGAYAPGSEVTTLTVSGLVTWSGAAGMGPGGGGPGGRGGRP